MIELENKIDECEEDCEDCDCCCEESFIDAIVENEFSEPIDRFLSDIKNPLNIKLYRVKNYEKSKAEEALKAVDKFKKNGLSFSYVSNANMTEVPLLRIFNKDDEFAGFNLFSFYSSQNLYILLNALHEYSSTDVNTNSASNIANITLFVDTRKIEQLDVAINYIKFATNRDDICLTIFTTKCKEKLGMDFECFDFPRLIHDDKIISNVDDIYRYLVNYK